MTRHAHVLESARGPILESLEPRLLLSAATESWTRAAARQYEPSDAYPTLISGDMGKWVVDDTVSSFPECGPTQNYAEISGGVLELHAAESDPQYGCADNIWVTLFQGFTGIPLNGAQAIPFDQQTEISFEVGGELDDPEELWFSSLGYSSVSISLETKSGIMLDYIFDRHEDRRENSAYEHHGIGQKREIFLDPLGGSYTRDLWADMSTIPAFVDGPPSASDLLIHSITFEVSDTGWGSLDNLYIGAPTLLDLVGELVGANIPAAVVSGDGTQISLPVSVTNMGNVPLDRNQAIDLSVVARPVGGGPDTLVGVIENQSVTGLKPGAAKKFTCKVALPAGLAAGQYRLAVLVDSGDDVDESDESNNEVLSDSLDVELGEIDLTGEIGDVTLARTFVAGGVARGSAKVTIRNDGNVPIPGDPAPTAIVVLTPVSGGQEIEIGSSTISGAALLPGGSVVVTVSLTVPAGISAGQYGLSARLDPADAASESEETNNTLLHADTWTVINPPGDLVLTSSTIPAQIHGEKRFYVNDVVRNYGGDLGASTKLRYYLSLDKTLDSSDHDLGSRTVPALAAMASSSGSTQLSTWNMINPFDFPIPYYILTVVDAYDSVYEGPSGEANNVKAYAVKFMPPDR